MAALSRAVQEEVLESVGKVLDTITVARVSFRNAKNEEIYWVRVDCRSGDIIEVKVPEKSDIYLNFRNAKNEEIYWVRVDCRSGQIIEVKVPEKSDLQVC